MRKTYIAILAVMWGLYAVAQPRAEYPRPQFERSEWKNLNGEWSFAFDFGQTGHQRGWQNAKGFDQKIQVPFCPESRLSGIGYTDFIPAVWYQRTLKIPAEWSGRRVRLNFGAADYETHVFIDGHEVGTHYGTGSSFSFDITNYAKPGTQHNLVVWVKDNLRSSLQLGGKQSDRLESYGCMYTRTTGIWQTVWMEPVAEEGLESVFAVPDIDQQQLVVHPRFFKESNSNKLCVSVFDGKHQVATATTHCTNGAVVVLPIKKPKLWSPESPTLYDVVYEVSNNGKVVDRIQSYVGMRKVHIARGYFYLNNQPYYQRLVLDQGFYPDGIWTAPTDEALKRDIELAKAVGFNGARLHQKSFEERYYYWADKLGYITWGESASWGIDVNNDLAARNFLSEWTELVERDRNHPSLVVWTPFNETWGSNGSGVYNRMVEDVYRITRAIDPTRPVNDVSGDGHVHTDIWTQHNYERDKQRLIDQLTFHEGREPYRCQPDKNYLAKYDGQPYMLDEFGGLPWIKPEERDNSWGYGKNIDTVEEFYTILQDEVDALRELPNITGFCYTQITDVEQEKNGIYYYDRTPKFDTERIRAIFERIPSVITDVKKLPIERSKNRGLNRHDFFYAGEQKKVQMFKVAGGKVVWEYNEADARGEISDAILMSDGHILIAHQHGIREIDGDMHTIWSMEARKGYEIHSIQPIGRDKVVYVECGNPLSAVVMEIPSKRELARIQLPFTDGGSHGQMRNFRLSRRGTMLLASFQQNGIVEYDYQGRELMRWPMKGAWGVEELRNGNILVASNRGVVRELDRQGNTVWEYQWHGESSLQKAWRLKNGNTIISNWFNQWSSTKLDRENAPLQAIEVTPQGNTVWELSSWNSPADLGPSTTIQPLDEPVDRTKLFFGIYK